MKSKEPCETAERGMTTPAGLGLLDRFGMGSLEGLRDEGAVWMIGTESLSHEEHIESLVGEIVHLTDENARLGALVEMAEVFQVDTGVFIQSYRDAQGCYWTIQRWSLAEDGGSWLDSEGHWQEWATYSSRINHYLTREAAFAAWEIVRTREGS